MRFPTLLLAALLLAGPASAAEPAAKPKPFVVEYYYKTKWGHADHFWTLFKKNHLPILKKEMEMGRIVALSAAKPVNHGTEEGRWDYRVTIAWKDAATAHDDFTPDAIIQELYPNRGTFNAEEDMRFEILLAHWDLPVSDIDLK